MKEILDTLPENQRTLLKKSLQPSWISPMLATLTHDYFSDKNWIYERKLDGERCLAFVKDHRVKLMSRNKNELNSSYPEIVDALEGTDNLIMDGEIVAFEDHLTSFSALQERMHITDPDKAQESDIHVYYYVFDLLYLSEYDITHIPLERRKSLLKKVIEFKDPIRYVTHRTQNGLEYYEKACEKGWEGVIAKRRTSKYVQKRSREWLKFKCVCNQEFVIGGYTDPHGERIGFGALLIGYYEDEDFVYAGKVGTGFDENTLRRLEGKMQDLQIDHPPFAENDLPRKEVHWVRPELVAEIGFTEWTDAGKLRHPRYLGLRRDKSADEVVRERPGGRP